VLSGCAQTDGFDAGERITPEALERLEAQWDAEAASELESGAAVPDETEAAFPQNGTVYWLKDGSVWHVRPDCGSLSNAEMLLCGTEEQARDAGKERPCKRCGT
jgi:hypothetical protein